MLYKLFLPDGIRREIVCRNDAEAEREAEAAGAYAYLLHMEGGHETTINLPGTGWVALPWVQSGQKKRENHDTRRA